MIRLRVPGSLTYRHLALRVVSAACKMAAPGDAVRGAGDEPDDDAELGGALGRHAHPDAAFADTHADTGDAGDFGVGGSEGWGEAGDLGGAGGDEALTAEEFEAQTLSAFGEAFNNIAIHGYRGGTPGDVDIEIETDEEGIVIRLMDTGSSFDPNCVAVPDMADLPESGMGLFIINSFMDEVDYRPGRPNVLRLAKRRDGRARLGDGAGDGEDGDARGAAHAAGAA